MFNIVLFDDDFVIKNPNENHDNDYLFASKHNSLFTQDSHFIKKK